MRLPLSRDSFPTRRLAWILAAVVAMLAGGCATLGEPDRRVLQEHRVPTPLYQRMVRREPLELSEIVQLTTMKVPSSYLVRYIDDSLAEYQLTSNDILTLRALGVSREVTDYLLSTAQRGPNAIIVYDPYWPPAYYQPYVIRHPRHRDRHRH